MYATVCSAALVGVDAVPVHVEVDTGPGMQSFVLAGLPDGAVREARVRVKSAIENAGWTWPMSRLALNLAPADLRKDGTVYDLPIALAILVAMGCLRGAAVERLARWMVAGELSLDGTVRSVRGVLPIAVCAREAGLEGILVPAQNAAEASLVAGLQVVACASLSDAVAFLEGEAPWLCQPARTEADLLVVDPDGPDMEDVCGQDAAKRALEVAAAGGHNVLMVGPPGSGKTMLSRRIPSILPQMSFEEALETTRVFSVAGLTDGGGLVGRRPFRAPHHTISDVGMVGGGSGVPRPGEISLAHNGILFLDELPEFRRNVLEVMRQPLEDQIVTVSRSLITVTYPARIMLVASMNPCPCGYANGGGRPCSCRPDQVEAYRQRISGPLMDRIDIQIEVPGIRYADLRGTPSAATGSSAIRERVERARVAQRARFAESGRHCNAQMQPADLRMHCIVDAEGHRLLETVIDRLGLSARAYDRILKVARTIADLAGASQIEPVHLGEAIQYRRLDRASADAATGRARPARAG